MSSAQPSNLFLPPATATQLAAQAPRPRELVYDVANGAVVLGTPNGSLPLAAARDVQFVKGNEINVLDLGAVPDYNTDNYGAFMRARDAAKALGVGVYIPPGNYALRQQLDWLDVPFRGAGIGLTVIYTPNFNGSLFKITANGDMTHRTYGGMTFVNGIPVGSDNSASAAIEVAGDSNGYAQYNQFINMTFLGFYDGMKITKGTHVTAFGLESMFSKNTFSNITANRNTQDGKSLIHFTKGSGTANVFHNLGGDLGSGDPNSSHLLYDGGYVVGDITLANSQLTGANSAVSIGAGATYKSNITFPGTQVDANTTNWIMCADGAVNLRSIHTAGSNTGGGASFGNALGSRVEQSVIHDLGADEYLVGNEKLSTAGTNVAALFAVDIAPNAGLTVEMFVHGPALAGASHTERFSLSATQGAKSQGKTFMAADGTTTGTSPVTITSARSGSVVTFTATFVGSGLGNIEAQLTKRGGAARITRLV